MYYAMVLNKFIMSVFTDGGFIIGGSTVPPSTMV